MASSTLIEGKDGKMYSDEFLAEIRELNQTLFKTVRATLEKTPFADCRQTLMDYLALYDSVELRFGVKQSVASSSAGKRSSTAPLGELGLPSKNVKFANGNNPVVIKEEENEPVVMKDERKTDDRKAKETPLLAQKSVFADTNPSSESVSAASAPLSRATGTSSLLAPLPLAFNFKPTVPANNGPTTSGTLPLMNIFPPKPAVTTQAASIESPPKFAFSLPTASTAPSLTAPTLPTAVSTQEKPSFTFSFSAKPFPAATSNAAAGEAEEGEDDDDTPPEPEPVEVKEEGAIYQKPCQLFFRAIGEKSSLHEKGAGVLFLKHVESGSGIQLLVRACNALRTVLLNILLADKLPLSRHGKQSVRLVCAPNPPLASADKNKPTLAEFFFKCDNDKEAQDLFERLSKERKDQQTAKS